MKIITTRENGKRRVQTLNQLPTKTQRHFQEEVNVNNIMRKYRQTGTITHLNNRQGKYADLTSAPDYFESINQIRTAQQAFDQLPSELRARFQNDPGLMLDFIHNPDNHDEGVRLGLFNPKLPPLNPNTPVPAQAPKSEQLNPTTPVPAQAPKSEQQI